MPGRYVCDIETPPIGRIDKIHCTVMIDVDTEVVHDYRLFVPEERDAFLRRYREADLIVGHNFIGFDHEEIRRLHGVSKERHQVIDTIPMGRLIFSDIKKTGPGGVGDYDRNRPWKDFTIAKAQAEASGVPFGRLPPPEFPGQLIGSDSLEAWGFRYGGQKKGDYSKVMAEKAKAQGITDKEGILDFTWGRWSPEMHDYMIQDARTNLEVFKAFMAELERRVNPKTDRPIPWEQSVNLTMRLQWITSRMERNGWPFDVKKAKALWARLSEEREQIRQELARDFPSYEVRLPDFIPKRDNKTRGYKAGEPVERWKTVEFNASSRDQISQRLIDKYGWEPAEYNEDKKDEYGETVTKGKPKVNDEILMELFKTRGWPECQKLARFFMLQKRIGQLAEGAQAWLKLVSAEGRIHGRYKVNGTVGGRAAHSKPNVGQVPKVSDKVPFGFECRELFYVPESWGIQMGADQDGLELRCLGSFLVGWDNGAYLEDVIAGDIHWANAKAIFGLPDDTSRRGPDGEKVARHEAMREYAKTIIYAMIYGGGDGKLGSIIGKGRKAGAQIRARMMGKFPALAKLIKTVGEAAKRGWIIGLDGRVLPVRSPHSALNTLLQSAGYVICAAWLIEIEDGLEAAGLKEGWDGDYAWLGWIHDEVQIAVREEHRETVKRIVEEAGRTCGRHFAQWRSPTVANADFGRNWAATH